MEGIVNEKTKKIGNELEEHRKEKGKSVPELSASTKIAPHFIKKMEGGDFGFLPHVYSRSFLKVVSEHLGLNPEIMARQLDDALNMTSDQAEPQRVTREMSETDQTTPEGTTPFAGFSRSMRTWIWGAISLVILVFVLIFFSSSSGPGENTPSLTEKITPAPAQMEPEPTENKPEEPDETPSPDQRSEMTVETVPLRLTATSVETTWTRVVFEDSLIDEVIFNPGDVKSWSSSTPLFLKLGNSGGLRLTLNGENIGVPGQSGRVRHFRIDQSGFSEITRQQFEQESRVNE
jgi:cytoskeletal protein RodZ